VSELELVHEVSAAGICTIHAKGVLDAHTAGKLDGLITKVTGAGCHKIVCVLSHVTYIASAGVGVFVGFVNTCKEMGGDLIIVHPIGFDSEGEHGAAIAEGYNVLEVFNLLGLAEFINVAKTTEEAVGSFG
jgi:anti-sigma B factor antagonist